MFIYNLKFSLFLIYESQISYEQVVAFITCIFRV